MKNLVILFILCLVTSCGDIKRAPKPDNFMDDNKMIAVMTDIYLLEGSFSSIQPAFLKTGVLPDKFIYKKHKIDSLTFQQNFNYYADRPQLYKEILEKVKENIDVKLKNLEASINEDIKSNSIKKDSLKAQAPASLTSPGEVMIAPDGN